METATTRLAVACVLAAMLLALFAASSPADTPIGSAYVSGHWDVAGSPYIVLRPITLAEGDQLTIDPGVNVLFTGSTDVFVVEGELLAQGTLADPVTFTSQDPRDFSWRGITMESTAGASVLEYCSISFASQPSGSGGGLRILGCSPTIRNTTVRNCTAGSDGGGVDVVGATVTFETCSFSENDAGPGGGGVHVDGGADCTFTGCSFKGNSAAHGGGIQVENLSAATVIDCEFRANTANCYGGGIDSQNSTLVLDSCIVAENHVEDSGGGGISVLGGDNTILNSEIVDNTSGWGWGAGIHCEAMLDVESTLIARNASPSGFGAGIMAGQSILSLDHVTLEANTASSSAALVAQMGATLIVSNTIVGENGTSPSIYVEQHASVEFSHCDVVTGQSDVLSGGGSVVWLSGNIFEDALFCMDLPFLEECSPCLGAGVSGSDIGCSGAGCPCEDPTTVPQGSQTTTWTRIKAGYR